MLVVVLVGSTIVAAESDNLYSCLTNDLHPSFLHRKQPKNKTEEALSVLGCQIFFLKKNKIF